MNVIVNFADIIIMNYLINVLCDKKINRKILFAMIILCFISFLVCRTQSAILNVIYFIICLICASIHIKQDYLYIAFICVVSISVLDMSYYLPFFYLVNRHYVLANFFSKNVIYTIVFFLISIKNRYKRLDHTCWFVGLIIIYCAILSIYSFTYELLMRQVNHGHIFQLVINLIVLFATVILLNRIESTINKNKELTTDLIKERYRNTTYDLLLNSKKQIEYLSHQLRYYLLLIQTCINNKDYIKANDVIDSYLLKNKSHTNYLMTGNELFDMAFSSHLKKIKYDLSKTINISNDNFYNDLSYINFVIGLLNMINENAHVQLIIKEKDSYNLIKLMSQNVFVEKDLLITYMEDNKDVYSRYIYNISYDFVTLSITIKMK